MGSEFRRVLVPGGAGFIGSNFARQFLRRETAEVVILDKLTYAGTQTTIADLEQRDRCTFIHADICDPIAIDEAVQGCDAIVNFAAETHVDRSLLDASAFVMTNVQGTHVLLEAARRHGVARFVQVSTDEVYGDVPDGYSVESDRLHPRSPYSASKAAAEMMVIAYAESYGVPAVITRGSNTYGPFQYPEKLIPLMITNVLEGKSLPVYGDGLQVRDWLHVEDHCSGIATVLRHGEPGQVYNLGGGNERRNLDVVREVLQILEAPESLIQHVEDRPGHDRRYAVSSDRIRQLGWSPAIDFSPGLRETVDWYRARYDWWGPIKHGSFQEYYGRNYGSRTAMADECGEG